MISHTFVIGKKTLAQYCTIETKVEVDVNSIRFPCNFLNIEYITFHCDIFQLQL